MLLRRACAAAVGAAFAVGVAGCGGAAKTGVSSQPGASLVRAGALAYVAVDGDLSSSQWKTVDKLAKKFPIRDQALAMLQEELSKQGVSYKDDIKPALGSEVDVAVVAGATLAQTSYAVLTKPDDGAKYKALVRKLSRGDAQKPVYRKVSGGWYVLSSNDTMINAVLKNSGAKSLADDSTFNDAMGKLPADALVKAYLNGHELARLLNGALSKPAQPTAFGGQSSPFDLGTLNKLQYVGAALQAKDNGLLLAGASKSSTPVASSAEAYKSKLISGVPADAFAFVTFRGGNSLAKQFDQLRANPVFRRGILRFERVLGIRVPAILSLFRGEVVFYARTGVGIPEFTLVTEAANLRRTAATLNRLMAGVARLAHARISTTTEGGVPVRVISFGQFAVRYAVAEGKAFVTTGPTGIADYRGGGSKLSGSSTYKDALKAAGVPGRTNGLVYLDIKRGVRLIDQYVGLTGSAMPAQVRENLRPLRSFVAYFARDGKTGKFAAFLEVE